MARKKSQEARPSIDSYENVPLRQHQATPAEVEFAIILNELANGALAGEFKREWPVGDWIVDFYFPAVKLAIEVDGGYHRAQSQWRRDLHKTRDLETRGITVLRLVNAEVFGDRERLIARLRAAWRAAQRQTVQQQFTAREPPAPLYFTSLPVAPAVPAVPAAPKTQSEITTLGAQRYIDPGAVDFFALADRIEHGVFILGFGLGGFEHDGGDVYAHRNHTVIITHHDVAGVDHHAADGDRHVDFAEAVFVRAAMGDAARVDREFRFGQRA